MRSIIALLTLLSALSWAQPSKVDEKLKNRLAQGGTVEVIVEMEGPRLPPGQVRQTLIRSLREGLQQKKIRLKVKPAKDFWINQAFLVRLPASQVDELANTPGVTRVYENRRVQLPRVQMQGTASPGGSQWALERIGAPQLWAAGFRGQGVRIGHLDTGVDASHPAIAGKIAAFATVDADGNATPSSPRDTGNHGTHTAGLLVGNQVGVAPEARLVSALVLPEGGGTLAQVIGGIEWVIEQNVQVISLSLGLPGTWPEFTRIVEQVEALGVVGVYAIGNFGPAPETTGSPGNLPGALGIGATDSNDQVAAFSSRGPVRWGYPYNTTLTKPDLVAPGVDLASTAPGGGYQAMSGTSMSTPLVAGGVALLLSAKPKTPAKALEQALLEGARPLGEPNSAGRGLINLPGSLARLGGQAAPPTPASTPAPTPQPAKPTRVLLVDDDAGFSPDTSPYLEATLKALGIAYDRHEVAQQGTVPLEKLRGYPLVLWILGEAWSDTLSPTDQQNLRSYLQGGGRLIVSGQDLGYDIGDTAFYREVLKAQLIADDSGSRTLSGPGGTYTLNSGDGLKNQYYPSAVQPIGGAEALLGWASAGAVSAQSITDNRPERVKEKGQNQGQSKGKKNRQPQAQAQSVAQGAGGLLASFGSGRVAYLSFGLEALPSAERSRLLQELFNRLMG